MHIGIIGNRSKDPSGAIIRNLIDWLKQRGVGVSVDEEAAGVAGLSAAPICHWDESNMDFVIVLGGDGTLLRAAKMICESSIPLLGVNMGRLGFLTEIEVSALYDVLPEFLQGRYTRDTRHFLRASVLRDGEVMHDFLALNDVVIGKGSFSRMISVKIWADDALLGSYPADGVILSTATGSTAYSLSAGGPVLHPKVEVLLATPICPHSFHARPVVLDSEQVITVRTEHRPDVTPMVTVDGQEGCELIGSDLLRAHLSAETVTLLRRPEWNFYQVLRKKLFHRDDTRERG